MERRGTAVGVYSFGGFGFRVSGLGGCGGDEEGGYCWGGEDVEEGKEGVDEADFFVGD